MFYTLIKPQREYIYMRIRSERLLKYSVYSVLCLIVRASIRQKYSPGEYQARFHVNRGKTRSQQYLAKYKPEIKETLAAKCG